MSKLEMACTSTKNCPSGSQLPLSALQHLPSHPEGQSYDDCNYTQGHNPREPAAAQPTDAMSQGSQAGSSQSKPGTSASPEQSQSGQPDKNHPDNPQARGIFNTGRENPAKSPEYPSKQLHYSSPAGISGISMTIKTRPSYCQSHSIVITRAQARSKLLIIRKECFAELILSASPSAEGSAMTLGRTERL